MSTTNGSSNQPEDAQPQFMDEFMRLKQDIKHARNFVQDLQNTLAALDLKLRRAMQLELQSIQREVGITFLSNAEAWSL